MKLAGRVIFVLCLTGMIVRPAAAQLNNPKFTDGVGITQKLGAQIPLGELATLKIEPGPPMIKSENSRRSAWVFVDISGRHAIEGTLRSNE